MKYFITALLVSFALLTQTTFAETKQNNFNEQLGLTQNYKQPQSSPQAYVNANEIAKTEEKNLLSKWWDLSLANKKLLIAIPIVIAIVLWGFFRFVFTGKQFSDYSYTVLEKIQISEKTFAEIRKNNNSGLIFYFTYGPIEKKFRGRISKEAYEELKDRVAS